MTLIAHFKSRSHCAKLRPAQAWRVEMCSWRAMGGCEAAVLRARAAKLNLEELTDLLRCGLELYDGESENLAWWGFVKSIEIWQGKTGARLDLESLSNRMRVAYGSHAAELQGSGARVNTSWADDLDSQVVYGVKELQLYLDVTSSLQAEAYRAVELAARSKLRVEALQREADWHGFELVLRGAGWWETLGWRYYDSAAGLVEYTTTGIGAQSLGDAAANTKIAQQFTTTAGGWRVDAAWALVRKVGAPADNLQCEVCANAGGAPGSVLATAASRAGSAINADFRWESWSFDAPYTLAANTAYWLVFSRSGGLSASQYYRFRANEGLGYAGGVFRLYGGSGWAARIPDADLLFRAAGAMQTTAQVEVMAGAGCGGQFLAGVRLDATSGVYTNPFRNGDKTAREEIEAHLAAGDSSGRGLVGKITPERILVVESKAVEVAGYLLGVDGALQTLTGARAPVFLGQEAAGRWAVHDAAWRGLGVRDGMVSELVRLERLRWRGGGLELAGGT